jgi:hypothetical protein
MKSAGTSASWELPTSGTAEQCRAASSCATSKSSNPSTAQIIVEGEIRTKHSFLSFQHPDRIADAVRLFSEVKLWDEIGKLLGAAAKDIKTELLLIVDRRNKLAHEADIDPSYPGQRWPINAALVEGIFDKLEAIARAIFKATA